MTRKFIELPSFSAQWKALGLTQSDLERLQDELLENPKVSPVIKHTGGVRKMRFSFEGRGKRGSTRVIYVDIEVKEKIYLLAA